ncbi:hypothetical protein GF415_02295 [Candidatus Micrarchaeota archaeon]|nr:hypothetical protein [Candidatus Micrarchaeota archaeon]
MRKIHKFPVRQPPPAPAIIKRAFRRKPCRRIPLPEAASRIGVPPKKLNNVFKGRESCSILLRFDFRRERAMIFRRHWYQPEIPADSLSIVSDYLKLRDLLFPGKEFVNILKAMKTTRLRRNSEMLSSFIFSNVVVSGKQPPLLPVVPESSPLFYLPVHELNGAMYSRQKDVDTILFCARVSCGSQRVAASALRNFADYFSGLPSYNSIKRETAMKLWFLRERYLENRFFYSKTMHRWAIRILESKNAEIFFSRKARDYF